jgi:hypothetical protein
MTITQYAKALTIPRPTCSRFVSQGMPLDDIPSATAWMQANKPNRFTRPASPVAEYYPSLEIEGDDFEARFKRLEASERYLSGQIANLQEVVLPNFVSKLSDCTERDRPNIEKAMFKANQNLLALRKEYRATSKAISDIEFKRVSTLGGMIPFAFVIDMLTSSIKPVMAYLHNIAVGVHDEAEAAKLNQISADIVNVFNAGAKEFIQGVSGQVPIGYEKGGPKE